MLFISNSTLTSVHGQGMSIDNPDLIASVTNTTIRSKREAIYAPRVGSLHVDGVEIAKSMAEREPEPTRDKGLKGYVSGFSFSKGDDKKG
ncbi:hypothetical protein L5849_10715 [Erythrobacter sp. SN021]|uniref:hypothetical protein n=1 Tax=Erythrobacter sp. SN021 TaxID=2912574 RepID=UPI001F20CF3C|nr:hypothetical protein [Erythrobacter sp. SN021]MCF8883170.1 hypothetical protein [Erythrobacter sp. SN021]